MQGPGAPNLSSKSTRSTAIKWDSKWLLFHWLGSAALLMPFVKRANVLKMCPISFLLSCFFFFPAAVKSKILSAKSHFVIILPTVTCDLFLKMKVLIKSTYHYLAPGSNYWVTWDPTHVLFNLPSVKLNYILKYWLHLIWKQPEPWW